MLEGLSKTWLLSFLVAEAGDSAGGCEGEDHGHSPHGIACMLHSTICYIVDMADTDRAMLRDNLSYIINDIYIYILLYVILHFIYYLYTTFDILKWDDLLI